MGATLPGNKPRKPWKEPIDRVPSDDVPDGEVQRLVLREIDLHERRMKWQLRQTLGVNDTRLLKTLQQLKAQCLIYCTGPTSHRTWQRL